MKMNKCKLQENVGKKHNLIEEVVEISKDRMIREL